MKRVAVIAWILFCVAAFAWRGHACIVENSATFDEAAHLAAGYSYWTRGDFRLNIESPPFAKLYVSLPLYLFKSVPFDPPADLWNDANEWKIGNLFLFDSGFDPQELLAWGRWTNWTLGLATILLVGWWACRSFGWTAGCLALGFACFEPNLLAISCIVNTDIGLTFTCVASCYFGWEYARKPARWSFLLAGVSLGLALASKFSAVFWVAGFLPAWWLTARKTDRKPFEEMFRLLLIAAVTILPCYFVVHFADWGKGFKQQLSRNDFDTTKIYYWGRVRTSGAPEYFLDAIHFKVPYGLVLSFLIGAFVCLRRKSRDDIFLWLPALFFSLCMVAVGVNLGLRVILPVLPFIAIIAAMPAILSAGFWRSLVFPCLVLNGFQVNGYRGRELSFFNPHFYQPAYVLGDSNLDWGQDLLRLKQWMDANGVDSVWLAYVGTAPPRAYGIQSVPLPGWGKLEPWPRVPAGSPKYIALAVQAWQGTYLDDPETYNRLRRWIPLEKLGGAIWIYDIERIQAFNADELLKLHRREIGERDD